MTSFDAYMVVGGAEAKAKRFETTAMNADVDQPALSDWKSFFIATPAESAMLHFKDDPVLELLRGFDLFPSGSPVISLDGVCYKMTFQSRHLYGNFTFSHPNSPMLEKLESMVLKIGKDVASKKGPLRDKVEAWERYVSYRSRRSGERT